MNKLVEAVEVGMRAEEAAVDMLAEAARVSISRLPSFFASC